ncbi:MAG: enoyl-CoA hydratase/isomerase family protein [Alphaproteobacteria bacterium]|nr:enoyl-CoA hydratase/isomerase family protein [Alphaproteobacteria bacterium]
MSFVLSERHDDVALVTLNRPERLNAIGGALLADLERALAAAQGDPEIAVIVLTGAGRAFCAGDDLKEFDQQAADTAAAAAHAAAIQRITRHLIGGEKPVVGAVHGYAVGGGFEWMLNCDLVVAADDLVAFFPEMELGSFCTGGVTHLLPLAVGYQRTMELLLLGERQGAERLHSLGLVNAVVPLAAMLPRALDMARAVAARSAASVRRLKRVITRDLGAALWQAVALEEKATLETFLDPEARLRVGRFLARGR